MNGAVWQNCTEFAAIIICTWRLSGAADKLKWLLEHPVINDPMVRRSAAADHGPDQLVIGYQLACGER